MLQRSLFKANGPQQQDGNGGTISFINQIYNIGSSTRVKFDADASVQGAGDAQIDRNGRKAISFQTGQNTLVLGLLDGHTQFSAQGGGNGGNGGAIDINTVGTVRIRNKHQIVNAAAFNVDGDGGVISIDSDKTVFVQNAGSPSTPIELALDASGGIVSGKGGTVIITKAEANTNSPIKMLNVDALIDVSGGNTESFLTFFGSITLNGVECSQTKHQQTWPKTIWQCGTAANGSKLLDGANTLPSNLRSYLSNTLSPSNPEVQLFNMDSVLDFEKFFATKLSDLNFPEFNQAGSTVADYRLSVIYERVRINSSTLTPIENLPLTDATVREASTIHELGHHLDFIWGSPSNNQTWNANPFPTQQTALSDDLADLDANFDCIQLFDVTTCLINNFAEPSVILKDLYDFSNQAEAFVKVFLYQVQEPTITYKDSTDVFAANPHLSRVNTEMENLITSPPPAQN